MKEKKATYARTWSGRSEKIFDLLSKCLSYCSPETEENKDKFIITFLIKIDIYNRL